MESGADRATWAGARRGPSPSQASGVDSYDGAFWMSFDDFKRRALALARSLARSRIHSGSTLATVDARLA